MNRRFFLSTVAAAALRAQQPAFEGPVLGYLLDGEGRVRPLLGLAGSPYAAGALEGASGLRSIAGPYGLDEAGRIHFCQGLGALREVAGLPAGWTFVAPAPRSTVAVARQGTQIAILRDGAAAGSFSIPFTPTAIAVRPDGSEVLAADLNTFAAFGADGSARYQIALRGTRALHYAASAWAVTSDLLLVGGTGHMELIQRRLDFGAPECASSADGRHFLVVDRGTTRLLWRPADGEPRELTLPAPADGLSPLRASAAFLLASDPGWIVDLASGEPRFSQLPRLVSAGGRA